jgi:energy-coupling factor transporter ATP-binding protein EcfA2
MNIDKVSVRISAQGESGIENFGFEFSFNNKLNLLTGDNSSGKSTVLSCIYYALGLEQLIGSKGPKTLSPALRDEFKFNNLKYKVISSVCEIIITANNGKTYKLTREIKDPNKGSDLYSEIIIEIEKDVFSKYVHAIRDHDEHGFYRWLAEVNNLDILELERSDGSFSKSLYMQNVFALSFIEQTKGWSDFFSMLPSFGIKDVKQKLVEYCLKLGSLESRIKLDELLLKKEAIKKQWKLVAERADYKAQELNFSIPKLNTRTVITKKQIESAKIIMLLNGKEKTIDLIINDIENEIKIISTNIDKSIQGVPVHKNLLADKEKLISTIVDYEKEHIKVHELMQEELTKQNRYKQSLEGIVSDLQDFQDIKRITIDRTWDKIENVNCPVCEQMISDKSYSEISDEKVVKTTEFLKSQKELYSAYLKACEESIVKYKSALSFYSKKVQSKKVEVDRLSGDISSPTVLGIRADSQKQAELVVKKIALDDFVNNFESVKNELVGLSESYFFVVGEESRIKESLQQDDNVISSFQSLFVSLLEKFGYKSNGTEKIRIENKNSSPLIPKIHQFKQEPQSIRYISSASDFVRSIWAYYIALLQLGKRHPGFLVLDEPGQHQMRLDSLIQLLKIASSSNKQVIIAISQDREFDKKRVNINELVNGLDVNEFKLLHIDDGDGCVVKSNNNISGKGQR